MENKIISVDGVGRISAGRGSLRNGLIPLLRMISFVKENKWARENGLIERYKALPTVSDFAMQNHLKVAANMVRALIEKEAQAAGVDFTQFEIKKQRNSANFQIVFNRNYFNDLRVGYNLLQNLYQAINGVALLSCDPWDLRNYQVCRFNILGSQLGMCRVQPETNATLSALATDLRTVFAVFARIYPAPVVAPEVVVDPIPLVEAA